MKASMTITLNRKEIESALREFAQNRVDLHDSPYVEDKDPVITVTELSADHAVVTVEAEFEPELL